MTRILILMFSLTAVAASAETAKFTVDEDKVIPVQATITGIMSVADRLDLLPGQSIIFKPDRGKMTMIRFFEGELEPEDGEIMLEFGTLAGQTSLVATNRSDTPFRYKAEILKQAGAKKGKKTSTCTLLPGIKVFESWPHAIAALRVSEFAAASDGDMSCR